MLSSQINFAKPCTLFLSKPSIPVHGRTNPSFPTYKQKKCSPQNKPNFTVRATIVDDFISVVAHPKTYSIKVTVRGLFPALDFLHPFDTFKTSLCLELLSTQLDKRTGREKDPVRGYVRGSIFGNEICEVTLEAHFNVPEGFGDVGAVRVENEHHKDVFLDNIVLEGFPYGPVNISCKSWVHSKYQNPLKRIFFTNKSYLPSATPDGLKTARKKELEDLRGNGQGERQSFERIYDYDTYNDLGDPDEDPELKRPVLGGSKEYPYPRRCRTGRPYCEEDPLSESRASGNIYVPSDEAFSRTKSLSFGFNAVMSFIHGVVPQIETMIGSDAFPYFTAIDKMFNEEAAHASPNDGNKPYSLPTLLPRIIKTIEDTGDDILLFEVPELLEKDKFAWLSDEEFGRQTLAGLNPLGIQLVREQEWPLKSALDRKIYGPAKSKITKEIIEKEIGDMTLEEALKQRRLFLLDYHDLLLPYVEKVRELEGTTLYGSRTLFFLDGDGTLRPVAIELTCPPIGIKPQWKEVFTPSNDATNRWQWRLAKVHVLAHDSGIHQLVSHWLRTHCAVEPYIIAANRQLSEMHPIYRLLHPHFRYTMEINANARSKLINAGGVIESTFSPQKYCLELSSVAYDKLWRFDTEALPADLIKRGMAVKDPTAEHGLKLTIEDYPYANDGLLLWDAIKEWVTEYVNHYYPEARMVVSDNELQEWWEEVRTKGHEDKKDEPWWPILSTQEDLIQVLTTIIWVASGHHAAVNFGQYAYAGYFPNRPTIARTNMPIEDKQSNNQAYEEFLKKPQDSLLKCFPTRVQAATVIGVLDVLSSHSPDEEYIGKTLEPSWEAEPVIKIAYEKFAAKLNLLEATIDDRNNIPQNKNRVGAGVVPYQLLKPRSESGVTGMGVPNSISI